MFKIGDKVVPHTKTAGFRKDLDKSPVWREARKNHQSYLYVILVEDERLGLSDEKTGYKDGNGYGDFFHVSDVTLFQEWEIRYFSSAEELDKSGYLEEMEWAEEHWNKEDEDGKNIVLAKFKDSELYINGGYPYHLSLFKNELFNWADENHKRFPKINQRCLNVYTSHHLVSMLEFIEELKANA